MSELYINSKVKNARIGDLVIITNLNNKDTQKELKQIQLATLYGNEPLPEGVDVGHIVSLSTNTHSEVLFVVLDQNQDQHLIHPNNVILMKDL
jgi:hypothetical protein